MEKLIKAEVKKVDNMTYVHVDVRHVYESKTEFSTNITMLRDAVMEQVQK